MVAAKIQQIELRPQFEEPLRVRLSQRRFPACYSSERSRPRKVPGRAGLEPRTLAQGERFVECFAQDERRQQRRGARKRGEEWDRLDRPRRIGRRKRRGCRASGRNGSWRWNCARRRGSRRTSNCLRLRRSGRCTFDGRRLTGLSFLHPLGDGFRDHDRDVVHAIAPADVAPAVVPAADRSASRRSRSPRASRCRP